jgi:beta-glucanase (GH16 family)
MKTTLRQRDCQYYEGSDKSMKRVCIFFLVLATLTGCGEQDGNNERQIIWQDEFDGSELDISKWIVEEGTGEIYGLTNWGNNEAQYYKKENISVENGALTIRAKKESAENKYYTSSRISTKGKFAVAAPARVEARIKMPEGPGFWPAFWMLGEGFPNSPVWPQCGEIDIAEMRGGIDDKTVLGTVHYGTSWQNKHYLSGQKENGSILAEDWHIYAMEWDQLSIRWYLDGDEFFRVYYSGMFAKDSPVKNTFAPGKAFFILLNLAVGGDFINGATPPDNAFNGTLNAMQIDWVRVWKW